MANWWDAIVTQAFGQHGEVGVDLGTPLHTPLTPLYTGQVTYAGYQPWGGEVDIFTQPGSGGTFAGFQRFLHLDQINVQKGQEVVAGQTLLGLSGGQTSGGSHPVTDPQYSTGAHTEVQLITDKGNIDPTSAVKAGPAGGGGLALPNLGINLNPLSGLSDYFSTQGHNLSGFFTANLIAILVGVAIVMVLFEGDLSSGASQPRVVPVPA